MLIWVCSFRVATFGLRVKTCVHLREAESAPKKKRSGANPQPEGFPFGSPHRRCDEKKKDDFWTRRVGSEADMCTRRVHPTRRVVFTSRGAKRRVRCEKKNKNSRTRTEKINRTLRPSRARDRVKIAHTCTRTRI